MFSTDDDFENIIELVMVVLFWFIGMTAVVYYIQWNDANLLGARQNDKVTIRLAGIGDEFDTLENIELNGYEVLFTQFMMSNTYKHNEFIVEEAGRGVTTLKPNMDPVQICFTGTPPESSTTPYLEFDGAQHETRQLTPNMLQPWQVSKINQYYNLFIKNKLQLKEGSNYVMYDLVRAEPTDKTTMGSTYKDGNCIWTLIKK